MTMIEDQRRATAPSPLDAFKRQLPDTDPQETAEWIEALDDVVETPGPERADFLLRKVLKRARQLARRAPGGLVQYALHQHHPARAGAAVPRRRGDGAADPPHHPLERGGRWWCAPTSSIDGHRRAHLDLRLGAPASTRSASTTSSAARTTAARATRSSSRATPRRASTRAPSSRAGSTEAQLEHFRRETGARPGLSSYPHPRLMPDFWEFPTVSMGLGPLTRSTRRASTATCSARGINDTSSSRVWAFLGDGEMDEPESLGALTLAAREGLDNLIFVVNCNLQRLDGPVRGNGKIIQELEAVFRGAGWNVIKVIWGARLGRAARRRTTTACCVDAHERDGGRRVPEVRRSSRAPTSASTSSAPIRGCCKLVEHLSRRRRSQKLRRGGHDYRKVYAAYSAAVEHRGPADGDPGQDGQGLDARRGRRGPNITHQMKKLNLDELTRVPRPARAADPGRDSSADAPLYHPGAGQPGDPVPARAPARRSAASSPSASCAPKPLPGAEARGRSPSSRRAPARTRRSRRRWRSCRLLRNLMRDPKIGQARRADHPRRGAHVRHGGRCSASSGSTRRTASSTSRWTPSCCSPTARRRTGRSSRRASPRPARWRRSPPPGTAYATHGEPMIPFYIFYSMFGFQRIGDLIWAFGDARGRGFLLGATAGRTTLNGEGLQHEDGHSHLLASAVPNLLAYDPAFAYELAVIVAGRPAPHVRRRARTSSTTSRSTTRTTRMPPMPEGVEEGILQGPLPLQAARDGEAEHRGAAPRQRARSCSQALRAQEILAEQFDVAADVWSATSYQQLRDDALRVRALEPAAPRRAARACRT